MTLQPYDSTKLDRLALRLFDLAAIVRGLSKSLENKPIPSLVLHDRKALEWLAKLEEWALESQGKGQVELLKLQAMQRTTNADRLPKDS